MKAILSTNGYRRDARTLPARPLTRVRAKSAHEEKVGIDVGRALGDHPLSTALTTEERTRDGYFPWGAASTQPEGTTIFASMPACSERRYRRLLPSSSSKGFPNANSKAAF